MSDERILKTLSRAIEMGASETMLYVGDIQFLMSERDVHRDVAAALAAECKALRLHVRVTGERYRALEVDILLARKQRDEAQVCACEYEAFAQMRDNDGAEFDETCRGVAKDHGWDCYPKGEG